MMPTDSKVKRRETTEAERAAIWALRRAGFSYMEISKKEGHAKSTVRNVCKRAEQHPENPLQRGTQSGRPPKIHIRAERALVRHALANPRDNLQALTTPSKAGVQICKTTVRRVLRKNKGRDIATPLFDSATPGCSDNNRAFFC